MIIKNSDFLWKIFPHVNSFHFRHNYVSWKSTVIGEYICVLWVSWGGHVSLYQVMKLSVAWVWPSSSLCSAAVCCPARLLQPVMALGWPKMHSKWDIKSWEPGVKSIHWVELVLVNWILSSSEYFSRTCLSSLCVCQAICQCQVLVILLSASHHPLHSSLCSPLSFSPSHCHAFINDSPSPLLNGWRVFLSNDSAPPPRGCDQWESPTPGSSPLGPMTIITLREGATGAALVSGDCTLSVILDILFSALASFFPCYDSQVTSQVLSQQPRALHSGQTNRIAAEEKMSEKSGSKVGQQLAVSRLPVTL